MVTSKKHLQYFIIAQIFSFILYIFFVYNSKNDTVELDTLTIYQYICKDLTLLLDDKEFYKNFYLLCNKYNITLELPLLDTIHILLTFFYFSSQNRKFNIQLTTDNIFDVIDFYNIMRKILIIDKLDVLITNPEFLPFILDFILLLKNHHYEYLFIYKFLAHN